MKRNTFIAGALTALAMVALSVQAIAADTVTYVAGMTGVT
jgi:hypothetical protein